jgi:8-hydroxy-5-deazaflavin:NADPH oxidoreductase
VRIGFIGSGRIGSTIARLAIARGHDVVLSNSRGPATLADLVASLGPQASAATVTDAAAAGDIVVVAIPVREVPDVPAQPLAGKIVIDANNYYPQRDGHIAALDSGAVVQVEVTADVRQRRHGPAPASRIRSGGAARPRPEPRPRPPTR